MKSISVPQECWGETEGRRGATAHTLQSDSHNRAAVLMIATFSYLWYAILYVQSSFLWAVAGLISALNPPRESCDFWYGPMGDVLYGSKYSEQKRRFESIKVKSLSVSLQK